MQTNNINWKQFFGECNSTDEIKKEYKRLARLFHPDFGGDLEKMKLLNIAFDVAIKVFVPREKPGKSQSYYDWRSSVDEALREIIYKLISLEGIEIEICGYWLWMTGNTRTHKEALKALGCKWSKPKLAWYFAGCESKGRGDSTLEEIREMYGSERIQREEKRQPWRPSTAPLATV